MARWNRRQVQLLWWGVGAALVAVVAYVLYSLVGALVFGIFLYYATRPIYGRLERRIGNEDVTAVATLLLVGLPMILVVGYGAFLVVRELGQLLSSSGLGQYRSLLQPYVGLVQSSTAFSPPAGSPSGGGGGGGLLGALSPRTVGRYLGDVRRYAGVLLGILADLFVMLLVAYYLLVDGDDAAAWFRRTFDDERSVVRFAEGVDADLEHIYWGNLVVVAATATIAAVTYYALDVIAPSGIGVPYVLLSAALTGIFTLIPVVGIKLYYFPMTAYLLFVAFAGSPPLWFPVAFFAVTLVVVDTVPDFFIRSWISSGDIHMGLILISYVFGSIVFGWYGIFLGPIVLVLFLHFARRILPMLLSGVSIESRVE